MRQILKILAILAAAMALLFYFIGPLSSFALVLLIVAVILSLVGDFTT